MTAVMNKASLFIHYSGGHGYELSFVWDFRSPVIEQVPDVNTVNATLLQFPEEIRSHAC